MILTCPSCSASYMVPAEAIGDKGRDVRCKKCAHVWFQTSEKANLDALINKIKSAPQDEDDISFGDEHIEVRGADNVSFAGRLSSLLKKFTHKKGPNSAVVAIKKHEISAGKTSVLKKYVAGFMLGLAAVSVLAYGLVAQRWAVVKIVPPMAPVYTTLGFPLTSYALVNPEEALVLDRIAIVAGKEGKMITGNLINLTSSEVLLPKLQLTYLDAQGQKVGESVETLPQVTLKKESSIELSLKLGAAIPDHVASAEIRFVQ